MTARRVMLGAVVLVGALLTQWAALSRLPLPGSPPDLLLVLVVAFALVAGPAPGTLGGFVTGLLVDLGADHQLGRTALTYTLVGYLAGRVQYGPRRSILRSLLVVAATAAVGVSASALVGLLLGDPRIDLPAYRQSMLSTVPYCVLLTPLVVPVVGFVARRRDLDPLRR